MEKLDNLNDLFRWPTPAQWLGYTLLGLVYACFYNLAWIASTNFELIPNKVSWYLPAGIMIAFVLLSPLRAWPFLFVIERIGNVLMFGPGGWYASHEFVTGTPLWWFTNFLMYPLLAFLPVWLFRRAVKAPYLDTTRGVGWLLVVLASISAMHGIVLTLRSAIDKDDYLDLGNVLLQFAIGDLVGIFAVFPVLMLLWAWAKNCLVMPVSTLLWIGAFWLALIMLYWLASSTGMALHYAMQVGSLLPAMYIAYRFGWQGALVTITAIAALGYTTAVLNGGVSQELQFYIIATCFTCIFIGAAMTEQRALHSKLAQQNQSLDGLNHKLSNTLSKNRLLSARLITSQEAERQRLSRDLHDDFGQKITDIKIHTTLAQTNSNKLAEYLQQISRTADELYQSLKSSIGQLRPSGLDEWGLLDTLKQGELAQLVKRQGLTFEVSSNGPLPKLSDEQSISLYRVCQECINNSLKYAKATKISVVFTVDASLKMMISDDGKGFDLQSGSEGFGLISISERAAALGGSLDIQSNGQGTIVSISLT